jgi:hypothetical protein
LRDVILFSRINFPRKYTHFFVLPRVTREMFGVNIHRQISDQTFGIQMTCSIQSLEINIIIIIYIFIWPDGRIFILIGARNLLLLLRKTKKNTHMHTPTPRGSWDSWEKSNKRAVSF